VLVRELSPASVLQTVLGGRDGEPRITNST
jgi:hypothetical protein